ncbi:DUF7115 domain-containing protein [Halobellus ordinarius]|uniref:DUF7115 domain-containing protein n=1 Tax=Halobellus ordinarius TaxID=3075120 RepID=UPI00288035B8|nr:hypothetical protein [Halobellus sp. ZY16]
MSQPEIVQNDLADEDVVARVDLGSEDELYVTPTRTLVYRAEGLLSDESVEEYAHDAERITVSEGRRKAKITLDYGLDGQKTISLPAKRLERALQPIVEGVFKANGVLSDEESIERLFRFSELTIAIAEERVVRHIGSNLWDEDFESYHYEDVTDLAFEDGSVATSVVLSVAGRRERFKAPNEDARAVRSALESTLLSYWEVDSIEELRAVTQPDDDETDAFDDPGEPAGRNVSFGDGPDPLIADPAEPDDLPENATRGNFEEPATGNRPGESGDVTGREESSGTQSTAEPSDSESSPDSVTQSVEQGSTGSETGTPTDAGGTGPTSTGGSEPDATETSPADPLGETAQGASASETRSPPETQSTSTEGTEPTPGSEATSPQQDDVQQDPREVSEEGAAAPAEAVSERGEARDGRDDADSQGSVGSTSDRFAGSGFESAAPAADEQVREELSELRGVVERQNEELRAQRELLEQLIEELRLGR